MKQNSTPPSGSEKNRSAPLFGLNKFQPTPTIFLTPTPNNIKQPLSQMGTSCYALLNYQHYYVFILYYVYCCLYSTWFVIPNNGLQYNMMTYVFCPKDYNEILILNNLLEYLVVCLHTPKLSHVLGLNPP